ncbi:MAG: type VI secretion system baseplate subunit TssK [Candidatus Aminicenantes bacterium]|jgi:type VI secretion system protein ImpJ
MSQKQKVVWYEGMNLDPHHFQQWDRYHRSFLDSRIRSVVKYDWGLLDISIDKESIINGQVTLLRCKGVTPDGLVFNIPDDDPTPPSRSVEGFFPATQNELAVFLAIPSERERGRNCSLEGKTETSDTPFIFDKMSVLDDNTGTDERQVGIGRTNFQLRFRDESLEDFNVMKIGEIVRMPDGSFAMNEQFIPPCLTIEASESLMTICRRLLELLVAKSSAFSARKHTMGQGDIASAMRNFSIIQTLNTHIPLLNHMHSSPKTHPEELYINMLALAGQLSAFSPEIQVDPRQFPAYDHTNLSRCFHELDSKIRTLLDSLISVKKYVEIPLEKKSDTMQVGNVSDTSLFQEADIFLTASGDMPEKEMVDAVLTNIRVASPDTINAVLASFSKALPLTHSLMPPPELPRQEGTYYFRMEPSGSFWESISRSSAIAIFVPTELSRIQIGAVAVKK